MDVADIVFLIGLAMWAVHCLAFYIQIMIDDAMAQACFIIKKSTFKNPSQRIKFAGIVVGGVLMGFGLYGNIA